jgi:hypothetical protein
MFLFIGLLCAGMATAGLVASETEAHKFEVLPHLTSKSSQGIIAKLRAIHPKLADFCNQESPLKDKAQCDDMLIKLNLGLGLDKHNNCSGAYGLFDALQITDSRERCRKKYTDPIDCDTCIRKSTQELAVAQDTLEKAINNKKFQS